MEWFVTHNDGVVRSMTKCTTICYSWVPRHALAISSLVGIPEGPYQLRLTV